MGDARHAEHIKAAVLSIKSHFEDERRRIASEMSEYPTPIPACDAQFNYLLEQRDRISQELRAVSELAAACLTSREGVGRVLSYLGTPPPIPPDLEGRLRRALDGVALRAVVEPPRVDGTLPELDRDARAARLQRPA